uniref:CCHC-type domain-containing protein n=1 Tax=Meloidogyne enterolobii TaxID=390850 RepID=A0A6V7W8N9_MELEN|nr:unnamed protein product [Meloidogyne enterolobii]
MSGPYKRMIGTVLRRLINRIENTEQIMKKKIIDDEEKESITSDGKSIIKILNTLEEKNQLWLNFINNLDINDRETETLAYDNYIVDNKHFYEWIEKGRETADFIEELVYQRKSDDSENNSIVTQINHSETRELTVQLPRLQLPEFNGDPHHWISFWQSFESSIDKQKFSQIDKMKFLLNCLKGEAKNVVSDLMLSNENYQIAVNTLKERFGDKNILIEALESELFHLPTCTEKSISLKNTVDKIEKIFRQLESIGENTNNSIMTSLIRSKLNRNILMEIAKEEKASGRKWDTNELRKALIGMVNIRESVFQSSKHFQFSHPNNHNEINQKFRNNENFKRFDKVNQTRTFPVITHAKNIVCYFCNGSHWTNSCTKVLGLEERKKRLIDQNRCFRCLRIGHILKNCRIRRNCSYCNGNHNSAICPKRNFEQEKQPDIQMNCD